jgi:hypothetical protein
MGEAVYFLTPPPILNRHLLDQAAVEQPVKRAIQRPGGQADPARAQFGHLFQDGITMLLASSQRKQDIQRWFLQWKKLIRIPHMSPDDMSINDIFIITPPGQKSSAKGNIEDHYSITTELQFGCDNEYSF